jgi:hypothetical protein
MRPLAQYTQTSTVQLVNDYTTTNIPVCGVIVDGPWETTFNTFVPARYREPAMGLVDVEALIGHFKVTHAQIRTCSTYGRWSEILSRYTIDVRPNFDMSKERHRRRFSEVPKMAETMDQAVGGLPALESADHLRTARCSDWAWPLAVQLRWH